MSWRVLSAYLDFLMKRGLIEKEEQGGKRSTYVLTAKGRSILQLYDGLRLSLKGAVNIGTDGGVSKILEDVSILEPRRTSSLWT